jgi:D-beta-D-heptose 7-phosphate kinase/D-beta-D-heptose 1-phosphate adenosyltransferase
MSHDLIHVVQNLDSPRLLVVGDLILDRYTWGEAERVSQEAPVLLLRAERHESRLGGAANVAHMIRALGGTVTAAGVVGNDTAGVALREQLRGVGVNDAAVTTDAARPTTVKERFIGQIDGRHAHQVLRVDCELREPVAPCVEEQLSGELDKLLAAHDLVLVSDYGKGVCTPGLLERLIHAAREHAIPVLVDPCRSSDYRNYRGATAITPNRLEAQAATGAAIATPDDALRVARQLCTQWNFDGAIVTLDADGMALACADGRQNLFPTRRRQVYDITGAGDMVLAVIGMCLAAGFGYEEAIGLANVAGGLEVERVGVAVLSRQEILEDLTSHAGKAERRRLPAERLVRQKVLSADALAEQIEARRARSQRIVFTNGCFDLLHVGHVTYLQETAALGDCLIVAINSDAGVRRLKGPERPIVTQEHRATMLASLEAVDYVVVFDEPTPHALLRRLRPDVLVKGGTYTVDEVVGKEVVEDYGGEVCVVGCVEGLSTTQLVADLRSRAAQPVPAPHFLADSSEHSGVRASSTRSGTGMESTGKAIGDET